ncbi:NAD(P)/FAD-dependent oxidoreductase [Microbacterium rhizophilus]|uniref:NAD(P)/FAD-dependent oxidoreductase n=1 Tax=Microbacterium rhizophilus TaxID=3138934 RepID=UPI0031EA12EA
MNEHIVIVGSGQAACQAAASLVEGGWTGGITLIGREAGLPYSRPPLSKDYLAGATDLEALSLRSAEFFSGAVRLMHDEVVEIRPDSKAVRTRGGETIEYSSLILATGAVSRDLALTPAGTDGVFSLRSAEDACRLRVALAAARSVVIVGAGFIGLEFAAIARAKGCHVTVFEAAPGAMGRAVSSEMSAYMAARHREDGIDLRFEEVVSHIEILNDRVVAVSTSHGERLPADLLLVAIGVIPSTELAVAAGIAVDGGIVVDRMLRTSAPDIYAIGDCARFPFGDVGTLVRLESVQNAVDQAKAVAAILLGQDSSYAQLPWFWSHQGKLRLQIAGLSLGADRSVTLYTRDRPSVYHFRSGQLIAVESLGAAAEHLAARRVLQSGADVTPEDVLTPGFDLRKIARMLPVPVAG